MDILKGIADDAAYDAAWCVYADAVAGSNARGARVIVAEWIAYSDAFIAYKNKV